ncbi:MAG: ATP-binding cassette domain-containing protein [bacterium]
MKNTVCKIENLTISYKIKTGLFKTSSFKAVNNVSLNIEENDIFGIVGESGCGKSTLCNAILGFLPIDEGEISIFGNDLLFDKESLKKYREDVDVIFQNPFNSLNPRFLVSQIISEPLRIKGEKDEEVINKKILDVISNVGLTEHDLNRYIFEFSGGQRQRIAIARSLITNPKFVILDEPTSALDVSIQSQICNLLIELKTKMNLTYLFVSHNLPLIYQLTNKVAVMYNGEFVEVGTTEEVFKNPQHEYTKELVASILD